MHCFLKSIRTIGDLIQKASSCACTQVLEIYSVFLFVETPKAYVLLTRLYGPQFDQVGTLRLPDNSTRQLNLILTS
jgi:hypothetical protein